MTSILQDLAATVDELLVGLEDRLASTIADDRRPAMTVGICGERV
jgi:hypothetical protein